jgi:putative peptidoglycan lipid II flippase
LFAKELRGVLRVIIWLSLPVAVLFFFARGYIVSIIKQGGDSTIAGLLGVFAIVILIRSIFYLAARSFYAQQNTKTPLIISLFSIIISVACAIVFTMVLDWGAYGLALAQVIWAVLEVSALLITKSRKIDKLFTVGFAIAVLKMMIAAVLTGVLCYFLVKTRDLGFVDQTMMTVLPKLLIIMVTSFTAYLALSKLFGLEEVNPILKAIKKVLFL